MKSDFNTLCVQKLDVPHSNPTQQLPLYLSSSFAFERVEDSIEIFEGKTPGYVYSRYGNPTIDAVANRLAALEGFGLAQEATALLTSSGMAAIHVLLLGLMPKGGKVLTQANLYGGTTELFEKVMRGLGIIPIFENLDNLEYVRSLLITDPEIRVLYLESPTNPTLNCLDLENLSVLAREHGCKTVVDNTFCTPYLQRPLSKGCDFVIHSTTKYLNGHGTGIAGAIIGLDKTIMLNQVWQVLKLTGATCNPFDAWMVANGIRTLPLRMERHCLNATKLASWLEMHPKVTQVNYPGLTSHKSHLIAKKQMNDFGGMLSFDVGADRSGALAVMNKLRIANIAPTLGDVDTLILHPASSSHIKINPSVRTTQGITEGLIRVSVGIEASSALIQDFDQALSVL